MSTVTGPSGFTIEIGTDTDGNKFYIGGVPTNIVPSSTNFVGCIRDIAYNFQ